MAHLAVRQNLLQVAHEARPRLLDGGAREAAVRRDGLVGGGAPPTVQPLEHIEEIDRLAAHLVAVEARHLEEPEDERRLAE